MKPGRIFAVKYTSNEPADLVLTQVRLTTPQAARLAPQALAVRAGRIVYVGEQAGIGGWIGPHTRQIDLEGRLALSGFFDSHCHATSAVDELYSVMLTGLADLPSYQRQIAAFLAASPGLKALRGVGWLPPLFPPEGPNRQLLDELAQHIPIVLYSQDYHSAWLNSRALQLAGISADTPNPPGGVIEREPSGAPNGSLRESAIQLAEKVIPAYTVEQYMEAFKTFQKSAHSWGLTAVHIPHLDEPVEIELEALQRLDQAGELKLRLVVGLHVQPDDDLSVIEKLSALRARWGTRGPNGASFQIKTAKIFMDGVIESGTAFLDQPYAHRPDWRGEPLWDLVKYQEMCAALERAGFQIHVHAIGDAAVHAALDGFAYARRVNGPTGWKYAARHGITHLQLVRPHDITRFAELGVVAFPQPYWFVKDSFYDQALKFLGPGRANRQYPLKSFFDQGVITASSSDYPVTIPPRPLDAIESGVTRASPGERDPFCSLPPSGECVSLQQMIASFTLYPAQAFFLDEQIGSLEVGKLADLIVLDRDIYDLEPDQIHTAEVMLTIYDGKIQAV